MRVEMNFEQARFNMIEQQVRPWDVLDQRVLDAMTRVPREEFVPAASRALAFSDLALPIGHGEVMMPPRLEGRMLQALDVRPRDEVLEVGTGSGFVTALLANLARKVVTVEIHPDLHAAAVARFQALGLDNISAELGDAAAGWPQRGPYDAIVFTGALAEVGDGLLKQLRVGGRMFAIVGEPPVMEAQLITRVGNAEWSHEVLFETDFPRLVNAMPVPEFVF